MRVLAPARIRTSKLATRAPGLSRTHRNITHRALRGAVADPFQGFLAQLKANELLQLLFGVECPREGLGMSGGLALFQRVLPSPAYPMGLNLLSNRT
jgi:hypothetical protein